MKTASSSSASPPLPRPNTSEARPPPAVIPLDYNYSTMSPSSSLSRHIYQQRPSPAATTGSTGREAGATDSPQYSSLFGDPVPPPPPEDFLPDSFSLFRRPSIELSSEEEAFGDRPTARRLFSEVPYSSSISRRLSAVGAGLVPRLQPPDIQILPHSSGGSSSEPQDSPNYALLTPDDILRRPALYDIAEPAGTTEVEVLETMTVSDATGLHEFSEATRRVSSFSEDFKSNVGSLGSPPPDVPELPASYSRQFSTESYSSTEWFRPSSHDFPEFVKMPRLRPSSKNVLSIKRHEMSAHHSPVAAMIHDSNGSSSGEERLLDTTVVLERPTVPLVPTEIPERPQDPTSTPVSIPTQTPTPTAFDVSEPDLYDDELDLPQTPQQYLLQRRQSTVDSVGPDFPPPPAPPPVPPVPVLQQPESSQDDETQFVDGDGEGQPLKREMSPAIITDSIVTGGDFRVDQARLHKKTSFTIISDKSAASSRAQSPAAHHHQRSQISPFLGHGFKDTTSTTTSSGPGKPPLKPRHHLSRKSFSSTQLKLPQVRSGLFTSDDSPRPSVQFNMTGRRSPNKFPQKGILQHRESVSSSQDHPEPLPTLPPTALPHGPRTKSYEALPLITDPYRTAIPRLHRSSQDVRPESAVFPPGALPRPLKPNPNPTRRQRGLLRVLNGDAGLSRLPLRSNWASMDDLAVDTSRRPSLTPLTAKGRRRSSSTSPERRSSTQTVSDRRSSNLSSVTTSDFSFRRPSFTPQPSRRKSLVPPPKGSSPTARRRQSIVAPSTGASPTAARRRQSLFPSSPSASRRPSLAPLPVGGPKSGRSRIAKPTTLSPIIGTPNKDSSSPQSPARVATSTAAPSETPTESVSRRGSISKIPIRSAANSRSESRLSSRRESRSNSPSKEQQQLPMSGIASRVASSRSPSRATARSESRATTRSESRQSSRGNSKAPSRSTSRASTKPISRGPSRASSRMDLAKSVANSRSESRLSQSSALRAGSVSPSAGRQRESPLSRRKSISLSPQPNRRLLSRRSSVSPAGVKKSRSLKTSPEQQRRNSRSRIPMRAKNGSGTASKSPPKSKTAPTSGAIGPRRTATGGSQRHKEPNSVKKAPAAVRKPESSVKRTPSSVSKQPAAAKKQPSALQRAPSNLRRETSSLDTKKTTTTTSIMAKPIKKEASSLSLKKAAGPPGSEMKRQPSSLGTKGPGVAAKATSPIPESKKPPAGRASGGAKAPDSAAAGAKTGHLKRQASNLSLIRAGSKMSLLSKKRSDSNLSRTIEEHGGASVGEESDATAQPVQITTALTNQLTKLNSSGQLSSGQVGATDEGASILEKSQKTLENIQKTVTEATDEIHKTINENLTDLKSLESDLARGGYESAASPTPSVATVVENKAGNGRGTAASASRSGTAEGVAGGGGAGGVANHGVEHHGALKSPSVPTQPIEAAVSVVNGAAAAAAAAASTAAAITGSSPNGESNGTAVPSTAAMATGDRAELAERNYELGIADKTDAGGDDGIEEANAGPIVGDERTNGSGDDFKSDAKRRSPDGQGGSTTGSGEKTGSQEYLEEKEDEDERRRGCCSCCTRLCMPCRRSRCSRCCRRQRSSDDADNANNNNNNNNDEAEQQPVLSAPSSATSASSTHLAVVDEKQSCWKKLNCCKRTKKQKGGEVEEEVVASEHSKMESIHDEGSRSDDQATPTKHGKCGLCLRKVFCCRSVNKVKTVSGRPPIPADEMEEMEVRKCCLCIPCRRKRRPRGSAVGSVGSSAAWQDPERGITATDASVLEGQEPVVTAPKQGCCRRFWGRLLCCKKKTPSSVSESRRASMKPAQPPEDTRRKLHVDLVEYNSKMKGAIPVMPLYLAWFCAICNTVFPGLGTLLSGFFCVCVGIPRFSQYDSAKARFGALIINIIVAVSQLFCVLFCFVGWGWSIWWGTIMLKCARKLSKIRKVERLEQEEEQRQAEQAAAAAAAAATRAMLVTETEAAKA